MKCSIAVIVKTKKFRDQFAKEEDFVEFRERMQKDLQRYMHQCHFGDTVVPDVESHLNSATGSAFFLFAISVITPYPNQDGCGDYTTNLKSVFCTKQPADVEFILFWSELWLYPFLSGKLVPGKQPKY